MQRYRDRWQQFAFVKQNCTMDRTNKHSTSCDHTVYNNACSRSGQETSAFGSMKLVQVSGQVNKWGIAKHWQNLPSVLRSKSSYQQEMLFTSLTALPAVKSQQILGTREERMQQALQKRVK
jgi:hypothetical protein